MVLISRRGEERGQKKKDEWLSVALPDWNELPGMSLKPKIFSLSTVCFIVVFPSRLVHGFKLVLILVEGRRQLRTGIQSRDLYIFT